MEQLLRVFSTSALHVCNTTRLYGFGHAQEPRQPNQRRGQRMGQRIHGQEMGPDGVVRDGAGSRLGVLRSRLQGTGEAPRLWLPLRHPSTGDACRGTTSLIPFETAAAVF